MVSLFSPGHSLRFFDTIQGFPWEITSLLELGRNSKNREGERERKKEWERKRGMSMSSRSHWGKQHYSTHWSNHLTAVRFNNRCGWKKRCTVVRARLVLEEKKREEGWGRAWALNGGRRSHTHTHTHTWAHTHTRTHARTQRAGQYQYLSEKLISWNVISTTARHNEIAMCRVQASATPVDYVLPFKVQCSSGGKALYTHTEENNRPQARRRFTVVWYHSAGMVIRPVNVQLLPW